MTPGAPRRGGGGSGRPTGGAGRGGPAKGGSGQSRGAGRPRREKGGSGTTKPSQPTKAPQWPRKPFVDVHDPEGTRLQKMLAAAGVPILKALQAAADTLSNRAMRADALDALVLVREGAPLASAMAQKKRFPGLLSMFARLGEQTGQLPAMLQRAAKPILLPARNPCLISGWCRWWRKRAVPGRRFLSICPWHPAYGQPGFLKKYGRVPPFIQK